MRRLFQLSGCIVAMAISGAAAAWQQDAGEAASGADEFTMVWYPTAECPDRTEGLGASPSTAIALDAFDEIHDDVVDKMDADAEAEAETPTPSQYECRWVTIRGFFEWTDYYHYRGYLNKDLAASYFSGPRRPRYIVENFRAGEERRTRINGARVKLTGRFYDLCRRAAIDVGGASMIFGPCHYGALNGLMLKDVIVEEIEAGPGLRLTGEKNRGLIGDLAAVSSTWAEAGAVKKAFLDWTRVLRTGREAYWKAAVERMSVKEEEKPEILAGALSDADDWISHLADPGRSPLAAMSDRTLQRRPFRIFRDVPGEDDVDDREPSEVIACACIARSCADEWPLFEQDALRYADKYLCSEMTRSEDGWRWTP